MTGEMNWNVLIQTFKFPGQFGTHIDFPGHFVKGEPLSEQYTVRNMAYPLVVIDVSEKVKEDCALCSYRGGYQGV